MEKVKTPTAETLPPLEQENSNLSRSLLGMAIAIQLGLFHSSLSDMAGPDFDKNQSIALAGVAVSALVAGVLSGKGLYPHFKNFITDKKEEISAFNKYRKEEMSLEEYKKFNRALLGMVISAQLGLLYWAVSNIAGPDFYENERMALDVIAVSGLVGGVLSGNRMYAHFKKFIANSEAEESENFSS